MPSIGLGWLWYSWVIFCFTELAWPKDFIKDEFLIASILADGRIRIERNWPEIFFHSKLMMGILLSMHIIKATPQYIIPTGGMTIDSAMAVLRLFYAGMESLENVWGIVIHYEQKWGKEE